VRDSLASLQQLTGSVLASKNSRVDKVNRLESKEFPIATKQIDLEHNVAELQFENKKLSQQLAEIRARLFVGTVNADSSVFTPAQASSSLLNEYSEGLSFFEQRQYSEALKTFSGMLDKGIEEDIADNCEYWIGECHFARREYIDAIKHFQKVLSIESSNKKVDAYFMLGKTYEQIGDVEKARIAYKELNVRYPNNGHAQIVKSRLVALKHTLRAQRKSK
jgi:TolA-binding protein